MFNLANASPSCDRESIYIKGTPIFYELINKKDSPPIHKIINSGTLIYAPENKGHITHMDHSSFQDRTHTETTTPSKNASAAITIAWYSKSLFKYIIWPLTVLILFAFLSYAIGLFDKSNPNSKSGKPVTDSTILNP